MVFNWFEYIILQSEYTKYFFHDTFLAKDLVNNSTKITKCWTTFPTTYFAVYFALASFFCEKNESEKML